MTERQLGIGVIGCGGIAKFAHLPNLARNPRARIVALADIDVDRARTVAAEYGVDAVYSDYHDLIANPDVEAVCVTTWPAAHAGPVIAAAEAGKHILCEKPIAISLDEADAMVAAADKAGVKFTMGYQHRFGTELPLMKQLLDEGLLGKIMAMTTISAGPSRHRVPWFLQKQFAGGGVLMDWGIYTAHTILYLMGPVETVFATGETFRTETMVGDELLTGIDVEDTIAATLRFKSGAIGSWFAAWATAAGHGSLSIDGAAGSIVKRGGEDIIRVYSTKLDEPPFLQGWRELPAVEPLLADRHYRKLAHLIDAVLDDKPLEMTGADGRDALELVLAIYRSAETGQPVTLPLPRDVGSRL